MKTQSKSAMLKKQMMSAVSMMLAAAVALGSSTYAWFVNKSRAEVKDVLFQASAGKNLQISGAVVEADSHTNNATKIGLAAGQQVTQGKANLLTYWSSVTPEIVGANSFTYPEYDGTTPTNYMTPVSIDSADLKITPGQTTFFEANGWDSSAKSGSDTVGAYYTYSKVTSNADKKYICAQLYFKASADMDVYLNKAEWDAFSGEENAADTTAAIPFITYYNKTGATDEEITAAKTEAKELATALRIAFVTGEVTDQTDTDMKTDANPVVAAFTTSNIASATYNTAAASGTGQNIITSDTPIKAINDDSQVSGFGNAVTTTLDNYILTDASSGAVSNEAKPTVEGKTPLFSLKADVPKRVTIYIWLEGTDKDCVSALSAFRAGVYLPFVGTVANDDGSVSTFSLDNPVVEETETIVEE
jgi:hypothetical protein